MSVLSERSGSRFDTVTRHINRFMLLLYILAIASLILEYGTWLDPVQEAAVRIFQIVAVCLFLLQQAVKLSLAPDRRGYLRERRIEYLASITLILAVTIPYVLGLLDVTLPDVLAQRNLVAAYILLVQAVIVIDIVSSAMRYSRKVTSLQLSPARLFISSFVLVILTGAALLLLPRATTDGITVVDALFTATSAVCVTGLTVVDTQTAFTFGGQLVIMVLIQIGGLGLMTFTTFFTLFSSKLSIKERVLMQEFLSKDSIGEIRSTLIQIVLTTLLIEAIGATALWFTWPAGTFSTWQEHLFHSVFHSVSAFCNAGFSLFSENMMHPSVIANTGAQITIAGLIVLGGLGFMVITNLAALRPFARRASRLRSRLTVHSRIVLVTTAALIVGGTLLILAFERSGTLHGMSGPQQILTAVFQSITCRTAGFNTIDIGLVSAPTVLLMIALMFIGASPGSTGGGIKTTAFALLLMQAFNFVRGSQRIEAGRRQIAAASIDRATATLSLSIMLLFVSIMLVSLFEPFPVLDVMFECVSAFGTVGLSRGITIWLTDASKITLVITMLIGRVGAITMIMAITRSVRRTAYEYPSESIVI